jgi:hypothetical protein
MRDLTSHGVIDELQSLLCMCSAGERHESKSIHLATGEMWNGDRPHESNSAQKLDDLSLPDAKGQIADDQAPSLHLQTSYDGHTVLLATMHHSVLLATLHQ